eukprot:TRINITY_DN53064_c0_g2_i7.p1 TRINITY_DN53064_c0_g2~~TRINITY_DN53064_c0_g2_i7.p1  ORF type:complete len:220 (+),score=49.32 TRINITY_DN53064_c0_g2_i7:61-720(+)
MVDGNARPWLLWSTLGLLLMRSASAAAAVAAHLFTTLNNGNRYPLLGIGVGNLQHERIPEVVRQATREFGARLIDTAAASRNEHIIADALAGGASLAAADGDKRVSVLTKVWYTHLGHERTKLSVAASRQALGEHLDTVLLHWPRCNPAIPWMRCEEEERSLPAAVHAAGPPPQPDSWKESWRALEDLYQKGQVRNIGVSNFALSEMEELLSMVPSLLQ